MTNSEEKSKDDEPFLSADDEHIVKSLRMAIAQIDMSIAESTRSVDLLMEGLYETRNRVIEIRENSCNCSTDVIANMARTLDSVTQELQKSIVAFQFFDRLTQRISHIQDNLGSVSSLIQEPTQEHPMLWKKLEEKIQSVYSEEQGRKLQSTVADHKTGKVTQGDVMTNLGSGSGSTELF